MDKRRFDDSDYSVVVKNRGSPPNSWRCEIYRAGRSSPIGQSPTFSHTVAAANKAGKAALKQLLNKLNNQPRIDRLYVRRGRAVGQRVAAGPARSGSEVAVDSYWVSLAGW
jgi:hypothetical protein